MHISDWGRIIVNTEECAAFSSNITFNPLSFPAGPPLSSFLVLVFLSLLGLGLYLQLAELVVSAPDWTGERRKTALGSAFLAHQKSTGHEYRIRVFADVSLPWVKELTMYSPKQENILCKPSPEKEFCLFPASASQISSNHKPLAPKFIMIIYQLFFTKNSHSPILKFYYFNGKMTLTGQFPPYRIFFLLFFY